MNYVFKPKDEALWLIAQAGVAALAGFVGAQTGLPGNIGAFLMAAAAVVARALIGAALDARAGSA